MSPDDVQVIYFLIAAAFFFFITIKDPETQSDLGLFLSCAIAAVAWPLVAVGGVSYLLFKRTTYYHIRRFFWKTDLEIEQESGRA